MATFSLDELRDAVDKRYAPTIVQNGGETFKLQNVLQLPTERREKAERLSAMFDREGISIAESLGVMKDIIRVATEGGKGDALLEYLGDNAAAIITLGEAWMQGTQLGEVVGSSE